MNTAAVRVVNVLHAAIRVVPVLNPLLLITGVPDGLHRKRAVAVVDLVLVIAGWIQRLHPPSEGVERNMRLLARSIRDADMVRIALVTLQDHPYIVEVALCQVLLFYPEIEPSTVSPHHPGRIV